MSHLGLAGQRPHLQVGLPLGGVFASGGSPLFHLFSGAAILCAFFIATDPVSAATSPKGRLIFGFGIGFITYCIRTWGSYADGVAFAVLLMNMSVPALDYVTRPRIVGHSSGGEKS